MQFLLVYNLKNYDTVKKSNKDYEEKGKLMTLYNKFKFLYGDLIYLHKRFLQNYAHLTRHLAINNLYKFVIKLSLTLERIFGKSSWKSKVWH